MYPKKKCLFSCLIFILKYLCLIHCSKMIFFETQFLSRIISLKDCWEYYIDMNPYFFFIDLISYISSSFLVFMPFLFKYILPKALPSIVTDYVFFKSVTLWTLQSDVTVIGTVSCHELKTNTPPNYV